MGVWYAIGSIIFGLLVGVSVYLISRKIFHSNSQIIIEQAKAKAKAIEYEAQNILQKHHMQIKEEQMRLKQEYEQECATLHKNYESRLAKLDKEESNRYQQLNNQKQEVEKEKQEIAELKVRLLRSQGEQDKLKQEYQHIKKEMLDVLSKYAQMTREEATNILLSHLEEELIEEKAFLIRRYEKQAYDEAKKQANFVLAQATTRYAGDFATERLVNVINLPNDELKGRIIGKEGRNIKTLETISGVDVIVDDTPGSIILSSFTAGG